MAVPAFPAKPQIVVDAAECTDLARKELDKAFEYAEPYGMGKTISVNASYVLFKYFDNEIALNGEIKKSE